MCSDALRPRLSNRGPKCSSGYFRFLRVCGGALPYNILVPCREDCGLVKDVRLCCDFVSMAKISSIQHSIVKENKSGDLGVTEPHEAIMSWTDFSRFR